MIDFPSSTLRKRPRNEHDEVVSYSRQSKRQQKVKMPTVPEMQAGVINSFFN